MDDVDKLYEELVLDKQTVPATATPYGGYIYEILTNIRYGNKRLPIEYYYKKDNVNATVYRNKDGEIHRESGPAYIDKVSKVEVWAKDGIMHRENGPALIHKNTMVWMTNGLLHNLNGPAIVEPGGPKRYWIEGRRYSPKEYKKEINRRKRKGLL